MISIEKIELPVSGFDSLHAEARAEGYDFLDTLREEWIAGTNRYDGPGEVLCGHLKDGVLIAVGGLNCDPFAGQPDMGRLRRIYVRAGWRKQGVGQALVADLLDRARPHFSCVRLRAENAVAARLYERMGFVPLDSPDATHILHFAAASHL
jgi:GNAT superfamily N-acetyltransferase